MYSTQTRTFMKARMHSSRMCTVRCSGHFSCHTHPLPHIPCHAHPPPPCMPLPHMPPTMNAPHHAPSCMAPTLPHMPPAISAPSHALFPDHAHPPSYEQNELTDRCKKHYLATTSLRAVIIDTENL